MEILPSFATFAERYDKGAPQVLWTRLVADLDTPVSVMLKLTQGRKNAFLLESVTGGENRGRYSVVGLKPDLIWRCHGGQVQLNRSARWSDDEWVTDSRPVIDSLRALVHESRIEMPAELPPMAAGLFGYLGYDMVRHVEHLPHINPDPLGTPDAIFIRPSIVAIVDVVTDQVTLVAPIWPEAGVNARTAYARAAERLNDAVDDLDRGVPGEHATLDGSMREPLAAESNTGRDEYFAMVERAKEYIRAGDIFQVVLSQRWAVPFTLPAMALYRALRRTNPSPYMFFFNFGDFQIAGASPEILVRLRGDKVTIRPIAGTRPRGATPAEDKAMEAELLADPKERAEHLMLLDLGRNDVGRVARIGTVDPNEQYKVERYSHVMHIVSNVDGILRPGLDAIDALLAGLPAGTVSGAPKVRAMQIIDELEKEKRGVYAGGVGYFAANGDMDTCIALRTGIIKDGKLYIQAGGGVVYDSSPEGEYQETVNKSRALVRAAEIANRFASRGNR